MSYKVTFKRDKITPLDKNPWGDKQVDEIKDYGFYYGNGPRIGIIKTKLNKEETEKNLSIICNECEKAIKRIDNQNVCVCFKIKKDIPGNSN